MPFARSLYNVEFYWFLSQAKFDAFVSSKKVPFSSGIASISLCQGDFQLLKSFRTIVWPPKYFFLRQRVATTAAKYHQRSNFSNVGRHFPFCDSLHFLRVQRWLRNTRFIAANKTCLSLGVVYHLKVRQASQRCQVLFFIVVVAANCMTSSGKTKQASKLLLDQPWLWVTETKERSRSKHRNELQPALGQRSGFKWYGDNDILLIASDSDVETQIDGTRSNVRWFACSAVARQQLC